MKFFFTSVVANIFGHSVDSILGDFHKKLEQLEDLIDNNQYLKDSFTEQIVQLEKERGQVDAEIVRAGKVHAQITKLIIGQE